MSAVLEPQSHQDTSYATLREHVLLLAPSLSWWKGRYMLPKAGTTVAVAEETIDADKVTTPSVKLLTDKFPTYSELGERKSWLKRFREFDSRYQQLIELNTTSFPIRGVRIIPKNRGEFFMAQIESLSDELRRIRAEFERDYDSICAEIRHNVGDGIWNIIGNKVPTKGRIHEKFGLDVTPVELGADSADAHRVSASDLAAYSDIVRDAVQRKVSEAVETMVREPREKLAEALGNLSELVARDGNVTARSFNGVRQAIAKIRHFDFVANDELLRQIADLETRLDITNPRELTSEVAAATGFQAALDAVRTEVEDQSQAADDLRRFGRGTRALEF